MIQMPVSLLTSLKLVAADDLMMIKLEQYILIHLLGVYQAFQASQIHIMEENTPQEKEVLLNKTKRFFELLAIL